MMKTQAGCKVRDEDSDRMQVSDEDSGRMQSER